MEQTLTTSIQDYLKTIYDLVEQDGSASTTALAARLGIAPASVTGMIQKLATSTPALVIYRKHQGVTLTPEGERAALEVIRHHRLIETYPARHGWVPRDTPVHDAAAAERHWQTLFALLDGALRA